MNFEIGTKWVEALRSGKYKQGKWALCTISPLGEKSYCCLGVLCEIAVESGVAERRQRVTGVDYTFIPPESERGVFEEGYLPTGISDWAGITPTGGLYDYVDRDGTLQAYVSLVRLNDFVGYSFEEIATAIEENLLKKA